MGYKSTNGLMKHLRHNGIAISGSGEKRMLRNTGYFHGYKGYRFFNDPRKRLPFHAYNEINATIQYDTRLKQLFYGKVMFIETAVKNIALECILDYVKSESIQDMYDKAVCGYKNAPANTNAKVKEKYQRNKLQLQDMVQGYLLKEYKKGNPKITHYYNNTNYNGVPIWALFEVMTLGDFAFLLSCLKIDLREKISLALGMNLSADTNRELIYQFLYEIKDLRNAIAHNAVIFDVRFRRNDPKPAMKVTLQQAIGLPYVNFKTLGDYVILVCYYLKLLDVSKTEIKAFVREFERITDEFERNVNQGVVAIVVHPDLRARLNILKQTI